MVALSALLLLVLGCGPAAPASAPSPTATSRSAAQAVLNQLVRAARAGDRSAYDRLVSDRDPAFAARAAHWFTTIRDLPWAGLRLTAQPDRTVLSEPRRRLLGTGAWAQAVTVDWRLGGVDRTAEQRIWLTFVADQGLRLAGWTDGPGSAQTDAVPLWLLEPVVVRSSGSALVMVADDGGAETWLRRTRAAAAAVRGHAAVSVVDGWSSPLLVQVPGSRADFERVLGVAGGSYAKIAAAAWSMAPQPTTAPIDVVVNPELADRLGPAGLELLLAHEAVHVAARSPASPAPIWLVEGYADYVAYASYPQTRAAAARPLLDRVSKSGPPTALPGDAEFEATSSRLDLAYAEAWLACRYVAERYGPVRLARLYATVDEGTPLDQAATTVLGTSRTQLVTGWNRYLQRLADDR